MEKTSRIELKYRKYRENLEKSLREFKYYQDCATFRISCEGLRDAQEIRDDLKVHLRRAYIMYKDKVPEELHSSNLKSAVENLF